MSYTSGRKLLSAVVLSGNVQQFIKLNLAPHLFKESEGVLYAAILKHVQKHGKVPSTETITEMLGDVLAVTTEPPEFYLEQVEHRYLHNAIKAMVIEAGEMLKDASPDNAYEALTKGISSLHLLKNRNNLIDFREILDLIVDEYMKVKQNNNEAGIMFGWPTPDGMTGGLKPGDVFSICGRPASGKTFMGLYSAHEAWKNHHPTFFASMEMTNQQIAQRLAAMHTHKALTQLMKGMLSTPSFTSLSKGLKALKKQETPFWLVDGNLTVTVDDIIMMARQLKPEAIWIDGAYLLRHPNPKISRFDRITENAESIKSKLATDLGVPVICSYQFNRAVSKTKKGGEKAGLDDIYGTDSIAQLSTVVMGLFETESIETEKCRTVEILKGRNGETGSFKINWDFHGMDFSEIVAAKPTKYQYLD